MTSSASRMTTDAPEARLGEPPISRRHARVTWQNSLAMGIGATCMFANQFALLLRQCSSRWTQCSFAGGESLVKILIRRLKAPFDSPRGAKGSAFEVR
jgi:hypothetical protein